MSGLEIPVLLPWNGAMVVMRRLRPINYLVGPAGAGKLRFAETLASALPDAVFLGAQPGRGLDALLAPLHDPAARYLIIDLPELDLAPATLAVLMGEVREAARLPRGDPRRKAVFLVTRSSQVIDLASLDAACSVFYFRSAHAPPVQVEAQAPDTARRLYDQVAACLVA